jgi:tetratricopeptide (TPR) repeat protein
MSIVRTVAAVAMMLVSWPAAARAAADQDALGRAKALYTSAAYDEALALLSQLDQPSAAEAVEANQYRAFCLLALGRSDDARKVIQDIIEANPAYRPVDAQMSPRLQAAFRDVRRGVLPSIVRRSYADAKAAFERKDFELAGGRFKGVIALLDDDDAKGSGELADLRILSNGFLDLIKTMGPAEAPAVAASPLPAPAAPTASAIGGIPGIAGIYDAADVDVSPPVVISQILPPWHPNRQEPPTMDGRLILVIDERGDVTSLTLQGNLSPAYAAVLRRAASRWKYQPAMKSGTPVKYRRAVAVHLQPADDSRSNREPG